MKILMKFKKNDDSWTFSKILNICFSRFAIDFIVVLSIEL